ncbi:MAG TPA: hypothetical protein VM912_03140 [Terriglobales bacterium]|nr:hypothetical protein [Terriglobales bacterium]
MAVRRILFGAQCVLLISGMALPLAAQDSAQSPQPAPRQTQSTDGGAPRILGVVPQFGVTSELNTAPLTTGQKFKLFERSSFDPFNFGAAGLQAGLSQASDEFPGYGQGAAGYGKRYGASFADQVSSNFFANFFYPTLLKEDPRYFRLGHGPVKHRLIYALEQELVVRKDNGRRGFAFDNVLGAFTSGTLSNAYYPTTDRGVGLTISRSLISILYGSAGGVVSEFWPDVQRKLHHHEE